MNCIQLCSERVGVENICIFKNVVNLFYNMVNTFSANCFNYVATGCPRKG